MKLFQQMLVAPAALGLLASGANAAELNINGVSDYAASADQVANVNQFNDVYPTDWAYQALSNLVEQYGCVVGRISSRIVIDKKALRTMYAGLLLVFVLGADLLTTKHNSETKKAFFSNLSLKSIID